MKRSLPLVVPLLFASVALAEPAAPPTKVEAVASELVHAQLLIPLQRAEAKRSRFSRAAPVALERRVRVLDAAALTDVHGKAFVRFALDERRFAAAERAWTKNSVSGCAYPDEQEVFVRRGEQYLPARSLLGKDAKERPGACRAASSDAIGGVAPGSGVTTAHAAKG